jgi:hypothetical protein
MQTKTNETFRNKLTKPHQNSHACPLTTKPSSVCKPHSRPAATAKTNAKNLMQTTKGRKSEKIQTKQKQIPDFKDKNQKKSINQHFY